MPDRPSEEELERTKQLIAGDIYWLSQNWEHSGAWAKVLKKSTDISQRAYVEVKIMELVPAYWGHQVGDIIKGMNATQLYDKRQDSSKEVMGWVLRNRKRGKAGYPFPSEYDEAAEVIKGLQ
tara:strand:- start:274 stop:639 length:366 start_codon:yes stop_codon:yes gene_type:complete